jgi:phage-related protein
MKQDRQGVRTASDLERKYDLSSLVGVKKAIKNNEEGLNKVNAELENFMTETIGSIENIQDQIDGQIHTFYYSGVPTLETLPSSEWASSEYNLHLGDLYYDKDTGYAYRFLYDGETREYRWELVEDKATSEALALANSAKDTADSKRRVFVVLPEPPYDNGDLWFNNGEIYICQISKVAGEVYATDDFILATHYTDDTLATQIGNELTVVSGTVTTIKEAQDEFRIELTTTATTLDQYKREVDETVSNMSYSFGTRDLQIANDKDPVNAKFNNQGVKVYTYKELNSIFNHNGTGVQKLIVIGESQLANLKIVKAIDEKGNACTDFHHLISEIQSLSDLED